MMPIQFPEANLILNKPPSMTDEECMALPICKTVNQSGYPVIVSCWKLNYEELQEIQKTGCIYLISFGEGSPPVSLQVDNPFKP